MQKSQKMKIELTDEDAELIDSALLNLVCMYERQTILDENEYQEYKKAYHVFDSAVCGTLEKQQKKIW